MSTTFSGWIIVLTSVDTFLSVKYPTKFQLVKSFKAQIIIILSLSVLFCSLYSTDWIYMVMNQKLGCLVNHANTAFYLNIILGCLSIIFPFLFMLLTNILIFLQLLKKSQINRNNFKRAKNLFRVSVGLNLLFLITTMLAMIVFLISNLSNVVFLLYFFYYYIFWFIHVLF